MSPEDTILALLDERDAREKIPFVPLVAMNSQLLSKLALEQNKTSEMEDQIAQLKKHVHELTEKLNEREREFSAEQKARLMRLEKDMAEMKEELSSLYKTQGQTAHRLLEATDKLKEKDTEMEIKDRAVAQLQEQLRVANMKREDLTALVHEKDQTIQLLQDEYHAIKLELTQADEKVRNVENENRVLVERWLRKMNEEAEKMNEANRMYESVLEKAKRTESPVSALDRLRSQFASISTAPSPQVDSVVEERRMTSKAGLRTASMPVNSQIFMSAHESEIHHIAISNDGSLFATGGADRRVKVFETATGGLKYNLAGPLQSVMFLQFSEVDDILLAASNDNSIRLWSVETGRLKYTLTGHIGNVWSARFTSDAKRVISGSHDRTIKQWDLSKSACTRTIFTYSSVNDICLTDDYGIISGHKDYSIRFWDANTSDCVRELKGLHAGEITSVSVAPDAYQILSSSRDNTLKLIDIRTFSILKTFSHDTFRLPYNHSRACFSSDGQFAVAGSNDGLIFVWDTHTAKHKTLKQHTEAVTSVAWSPLGEGRLMSVDKDHRICLWH